MQVFTPVTSKELPCKCCGEAAGIFGVVDFNKSCLERTDISVFRPSGIPIYYHRCRTCGLIFTAAFDGFSKEDFALHVYNDSYELVDPEYTGARPAKNAKMIEQAFGRSPRRTILDYGGGNGKLAELLRAAGFFNAESYDPFVAGSETLPAKKFELIFSFEVVEHSPTPMATFREMTSLLADDGMIFFSTMAQPGNIDQIGLSWWYAAPRNGHVTLYSNQSLKYIAGQFGLIHQSPSAGVHLMYRTVPEFARHLFTPAGLAAR